MQVIESGGRLIGIRTAAARFLRRRRRSLPFVASDPELDQCPPCFIKLHRKNLQELNPISSEEEYERYKAEHSREVSINDWLQKIT